MSKTEGKSRKPLIIVLIALVVVLAVVLALVLTMCSGPTGDPTDDTSGAGMEYTLFWNVDRALYTGNSQQGTGMTTREPDPDTGYYHVLFSTGGRQVQRRVAQRRVVNKIDSLDLMGLVFDEKGIITDALDVEDITGGYAVNRFYVETVDGLNVVVNSSKTLKGMQEELTLTQNTKIYDVSGESEYIGAQTGALYEMDCIIAIKNTAGEITDVFVVEREPQGPVQTKYCDHCKQEVTWKAWAYTNGLPQSSGHFYLINDLQLENQNSMPENCQVILDLNGKTVVGAKGMRMYSLHNTGCYLAMMDYSAEQTGKFVPMGDISDQGAAVWLRYGQFDFYGGTLDGSQAVNHLNGGVVALEEGTLFNMYGGTITGGTNAAMSRANGSIIGGWGGNVYVYNGTFNMYAGVIKDGTATGVVRGEDGVYVGGYAGNVGIDGKKAVFNMYGGEILNGKAEQGGGNIWEDSATVTIDDGLISGGKITMEDRNGGNLFIASVSTVTMNGGQIVGGETYNVGANVYIGGEGKLIMNGGLIDKGKMLEYRTEKVLVGDSENIFCVNSHIVVTGGTITGDINVLDYQGGTSTVTLSGNPVINGSADGSNNLKIPDGHRLILGELTEGADISVSATGIFTQETVEANTKYFHVDNSEHVKVDYYNKCLTVGEVLMHCVCGSTNGKHIGECDGKTHAWMPASSITSMMAGGYWHLTGDVGVEEGSTFNMQHAVDDGQKVYIDLNGHTIQNNACGNNRLFRVMGNKDGLLVITDSSKDHTGKLVSNSVNGDQGLLLWVPTGTVQVYNVTLDASKATSLMDGAAISVEGGKLQMWNATVIGGTTTGNAYAQSMKDSKGNSYVMYLERGGAGGAIAANSGTLEMTGCVIRGGTAVGAYVTGLGKEGENNGVAGINGRGGALFINAAVVTLNNCQISDGVVKTESYYEDFIKADGQAVKASWVYGGNIYISGNGTLNMTDCTVSGGISGGDVKAAEDVQTDKDGVLLAGCEPKLWNIGRGGNIWTMGTLNATNCTITGGRSSQQGGNLSIENGTVNLILCNVTKGNAFDSGDLMDIRNDVNVTIQGGNYSEADHTVEDPGHDVFFIAPGTIKLSSHTAADGTVTPLVFKGNIELHAYAATGTLILDGQVQIDKLYIPTNRVITIGENFDEANSNVCIVLNDATDYTGFIGVGAKEGDEKGFTTTLGEEAGLCRDKDGNLWFGKFSCICGSTTDVHIGECTGEQHLWYPTDSPRADGKYYYLIKDWTIDKQWAFDGTLNLSLNGHSMKLENQNTEDEWTHRLLHLYGNAVVNITNWNNTAGGALINHTGFNSSENPDVGLVVFVRAGSSAKVNLYNVTLDAKNAPNVSFGGAVYNTAGSEVNLYSCEVIGTSVSEQGGAIWNGGIMNMVGCTLIGDNDAETKEANQGGAIYNEGTMDMAGCTVSGFSSTLHGGNIFNPGTLTLTDCVISDGEGAQGGNIFSNGLSLTIKGGSISGGVSGDNGNLYLCNNNGVISITDCQITNGGIRLDQTCTVTMTNVTCDSAIHVGESTLNIVSGSYSTLSGTETSNIAVSGGMFQSYDPQADAFLAENYITKHDAATDTYTVVYHEHSYGAGVVTAPTCTTEGYTTYTCECGHSYTGNTVPVIDHSFGENGICVCGLMRNCICGHAGTAEDPHTGDCDGTQYQWKPISNLSGLGAGGYYYLTADVTTSSADGAEVLLDAGAKLYLNLNGHSITRGGGARLFDMRNATADTLLVLTDTSANPGTVYGTNESNKDAVTDQGAIFWLKGGQLQVYNVILDACDVKLSHFGSVLSTNGASADVATKAAFYNVTMYGGVGISDEQPGSTIYVTDGAESLIMTGCTVHGHAAVKVSDVFTECETTINDSTINGIVISKGNLTMVNSTVNGSMTVTNTSGLANVTCTALVIDECRVTINGGSYSAVTSDTQVILENTVAINKLTLDGATAYIWDLDFANSRIGVNKYGEFGVYIPDGLTIEQAQNAFHAADGVEGDVYIDHGSLWIGKFHCECGDTTSGTCITCGTDAVAWAPVDSITTALQGGHYYLINDVELDAAADSALRLGAGDAYYIDLNGHTVTRSEAMRSANVRMFDIFGSGATNDMVLVITDTSKNHTGILKAGESTDGDPGVILWATEGDVRIYNLTMDASQTSGSMFGSVLSTNSFYFAPQEADYRDAEVLLYNVKIKGGIADVNADTIYADDRTKSLTMIDCIVYDNGSSTNCDIFIDCEATLTNCTINGTISGNGAVSVNTTAQLKEVYEAGAGSIKLTADVELIEVLDITRDLTLDLNGNCITASAAVQGSMFNVDGKTLTLKGNGVQNSVITTGSAVTSMVHATAGSTVNLDGVKLVAATDSNKSNQTIGIAICANGAAVNMTNSIIDASLNNTASDVNNKNGTAVYLNFSGTMAALTMNGDSQILGGWAKNASAVVSIFSPITMNGTSQIVGAQSNYQGGNVFIDGHVSLGNATIILNNSAKITGGHTAQFGGNIWMGSNCHVVLNDNGEISGGAADWSVGGDEIYVDGTNNTLTINSAGVVVETDTDSLVVATEGGLTVINNA